MLELFGLSTELLAKSAVVVMVINAILSGLKLALEKMAPTTESQVDDKAVGIVGVIMKIVDFFSANISHK